jgi:LmbE family N-acetylglucosaminyl deacetylase
MKGSYDQEMTSERLARVRKAEEEAACSVLGIPAHNIIWMGHDDGELEKDGHYVEAFRYATDFNQK